MKEKIKASFIHLLISALIIGLFYLFVINVWYPGPYFQVSGLLSVMLMLIGIDLVLGPLLTFIVFKPKKPTLRFDLSVIAAIQIVALIYGGIAVYKGHPIYVAYAVDRFTLISVGEADPNNSKYEDFNVSTFGKPKLVYAKMPAEQKLINKITLAAVYGGPDLENHSEFYEPIDKYKSEILKRSINLEKLLAFNDSKEKLQTFLKAKNKKASDYAYLPLMGKAKVVLWVLDKKDAKPVGVLDIDPWELDRT
jgi:hypothetical protein